MAIILNFFLQVSSAIWTKAKTSESETKDVDNTMFRQTVPQFQKLRF